MSARSVGGRGLRGGRECGQHPFLGEGLLELMDDAGCGVALGPEPGAFSWSPRDGNLKQVR